MVAGWWFMVSQSSILLLVLIAATWTCLDSRPSVAWKLSQQGSASDHGPLARRSHLPYPGCAGVTVLLCAMMFQQTYGNFEVNASAVGTSANTTAVPILFCVLLNSVSLCTLVLCTMICLASLAAVRSIRFAKSPRMGSYPLLGWQRDCPASRRNWLARSFWAGQMTASCSGHCSYAPFWGAGFAIQRALRRRSTTQNDSHLPALDL